MIRRIVTFWACCAVASAQLPPPQGSAPPADDLRGRAAERPPSIAQLDAVAYDSAGQPVAGLVGSDFTVSANGATQAIQSCVYKAGEPLRLAIILDDLSLSPSHNNAARADLRAFLSTLGAAAEVAILRSSAGSAATDRFTSDRSAWTLTLNRASYNPAADAAPPDTVGGTFRGAVRGVIEGVREFPGRKAVLVISERLRDPSRGSKIPTAGLAAIANGAGAVLYFLDMSGASELTTLDLGLSQAAQDTGGMYFNGGSASTALKQIARDQAGYYLITYSVDGGRYDYLAAGPLVERVKLTSSRAATVRARNGHLKLTADTSQAEEADANLTRAVGREFLRDALPVRVTALTAYDGAWRASALVQVDCAAVTLLRGADGKYRASTDIVAALRSDIGAIAEERTAHTLEVTLTENGVGECRRTGLGYTATLPLPKPGSYQMFVVVRDNASGRIGAARGALTADWGANQLSLSSIVLHGEVVNGAVEEPAEATIERRFRAGRRVYYEYALSNVMADNEKRSTIEVSARIWRDGTQIVQTDPLAVRFDPSDNPARRAASGSLALRPETTPGRYVLGVTVVDKLSGRKAAGYMDFEVRP